MCVPNNNKKQIRLKFFEKKKFSNLENLEKCASENFQDVLSISTQYTKLILFYINKKFLEFQNSSGYKILVGTTQPAHIIALLAVVAILYVSSTSHEHKTTSQGLNFIYLLSFSAHFGSQIWMTFISGLALYFSLPRHTFGNVQKVLFPKYFALNSFLTLITLISYVNNIADVKQPQVVSQTRILMASFIINLLIRLYLAPPLLKLMAVKNKIELAAGVGMEVGTQDVGELKNCPHYINIYRAFRKVHMLIALGNIAAMVCTTSHAFYLSTKLCLVS